MLYPDARGERGNNFGGHVLHPLGPQFAKAREASERRNSFVCQTRAGGELNLFERTDSAEKFRRSVCDSL